MVADPSPASRIPRMTGNAFILCKTWAVSGRFVAGFVLSFLGALDQILPQISGSESVAGGSYHKGKKSDGWMGR